jgi:hypothetical protein
MAARVQVQREPILPNIGLDEKTLTETAAILSYALSDEVSLPHHSALSSLDMSVHGVRAYR